MGLSNCLNDAPTDSIPIFFIAATAAFVSYLRSLFSSILWAPPAPDADAASSSGLIAGLVALAEFLSSNRPFAYDSHGEEEDCVVCLCGMKGGDRVRRLSCCHVFHSECLDGWFDQRKLSCPLCRSPLTVSSNH